MMPDWLSAALGAPTMPAPVVGVRLLSALVLGAFVAGIYRQTREPAAAAPTFPATLVLLSILIAAVTQVIGDSVARAFSLVGALSIVRFRTVVRDTQDTAFVIFAVVVGMAAGAGAPWVGVLSLVVVGAAAFAMKPATAAAHPGLRFTLAVRVGLAVDLDMVLGAALDAELQSRQLVAIETTRQGTSFDVTYEVVLRPSCSPDELVKHLYRIDGVHAVELRRPATPEAP